MLNYFKNLTFAYAKLTKMGIVFFVLVTGSQGFLLSQSYAQSFEPFKYFVFIVALFFTFCRLFYFKSSDGVEG